MRKEKDTVHPYPEGVGTLQKETAKRNRPNSEAVGSPESAPQDYDIRQSERVWEFQNKDFWIRPTDLSWYYLILVTIREIPFKNYRGRSAGKQRPEKPRLNGTRKIHLGPGSHISRG